MAELLMFAGIILIAVIIYVLTKVVGILKQVSELIKTQQQNIDVIATSVGNIIKNIDENEEHVNSLISSVDVIAANATTTTESINNVLRFTSIFAKKDKKHKEDKTEETKSKEKKAEKVKETVKPEAK